MASIKLSSNPLDSMDELIRRPFAIPTWWQRQQGEISSTFTENSLISQNADAFRLFEVHPMPPSIGSTSNVPTRFYPDIFNLMKADRPEFEILAYENHQPISYSNMFASLLK